MKKLILASLLALVSPLFLSCERQNWEETKMFHDVPKKGGHGDAGETEKAYEKKHP